MEEKERYAEHTVAWELPTGDSVTKGNYNLADIETKYIPIQTEMISDDNDYQEEIRQLKQSQKQLAIEELEKLREYIVLNDEYDEEIGCNIIKTFDLIEDLADKIKSLKGEE